MKRTVSLLLVLCLCACLCACASGDKETVSMYDLRLEMEKAATGLPEMLSASSSDENAKELFSYISDMDYDMVEAYFVSYANGPSSYEIAVIVVKNPADVDIAVESLEAHRKSRVAFYKSYGVSEVPRAESAFISAYGRYAVLIMTDNNTDVKSAFEDFIK